jgi:outer membrane protein assembly factor BamB
MFRRTSNLAGAFAALALVFSALPAAGLARHDADDKKKSDAPPMRAAAVLWSHKLAEDIKWYRITESGTPVVGTGSSVYALDAETGAVSWNRDDFKGVNEYETHELPGTPLFLVADNTGGMMSKKTRLVALDMLSGKTVWQTEHLKGSTVGVAPNYDKNMLVFLTVPTSSGAGGMKPDITALRLDTGELIWHSEFPDKVDLYGMERGSKYFPKFDLSGANPPVFDADSVYFTYAGLHRYSLADGKMIWGTKYDVTEGQIKHANAQAIIDGDTVYTSAKGQVRAIDKATGAIKWTSKDFGGGIAEMRERGGVIYGRLGGNFYDFGRREYVTKKPLGVAAIDKKTGAPQWFYDKASNSITNMIFMPEQNLILIADEKNLIGLDTTGAGKVKEAFKTKLEFKFNLGAAATVAKVAKFGFGGLSAIGSKGADTTDNPVALYRQENGTVVVRGAQHVAAFDPRTREMAWGTKYGAPGMAGWKKIAMTALTVFSAMTAVEASAAAPASSFSSQNSGGNFVGAMSNYEQYMSRRHSAAKASGNYAYVLTEVKQDGDKGVGIVGVNMLTGQGERQIMFKDKQPDYEVDEAGGRVYNFKDKQIMAFAVR